MNVLMVSIDRKIFEAESLVRARMIDYGSLVDELHIIVFTRRENGYAPQRLGKNVHVYPTNSYNRWFYVRGAVRVGKMIAKVARIDLVTAQDPFEAGLAGYRIARWCRAKFQVQVHTDFTNPYFLKGSPLNRARLRIARRILPKASCIRVVSSRIKESIERKFDGMLRAITVLPIFVNVPLIRSHAPQFNLAERFPWSDFFVLVVSRLEPEKNVSLAVEAMAPVIKKHPATALVIVGDGREKSALERKAQLLGIGNNVIFEGWQSDTLSYYKNAQLFLLTSYYEGYGMSLVEAAAADCPVVTTDVGIARELFLNNERVFVCPAGDRECLTKMILVMRENEKARNTFVLKTQAMLDRLTIKDKEAYLAQYKRMWEKCAEEKVRR